jgi:hypothetical protein
MWDFGVFHRLNTPNPKLNVIATLSGTIYPLSSCIRGVFRPTSNASFPFLLSAACPGHVEAVQ